MSKSLNDLPTISTVAQSASVSVTTVSRVLNGKTNVTEEKRQRVQEAILALNYQPQQSARSLAGANSMLIALLYSASDSRFVPQFQNAAIRACRQSGRSLLVECIDHAVGQPIEQVEAFLASLRPDGIILTGPLCADPWVRGTLNLRRMPFVTLQPGGDPKEISSITSDEVGAGEALTSHLIELGHTSVAYLRSAAQWVDNCQRGFARAMRSHDIEVNRDFVVQSTAESGTRLVYELLRRAERPSAIVASSVELALNARTAAQLAGLSVPGDLSLACFDDINDDRFVHPALTMMRRPIAAMASAAVSALIAIDRSKPVAPRPAGVLVPHAAMALGSTARRA